MKSSAIVLVVLLAAAAALPPTSIQPDPRQPKVISGVIASLLEEVSQQIKDAGLDPWTLEKFAEGYQLPVPILFSISGFLNNVSFTGLSNIVINYMNYSLFGGVLTLDISLPEIAVATSGAGVDATILGSDFEASVSGKLAIIEPRIFGQIHVNTGIITGIFVTKVDLEFDLGGIQFDGHVNLLGVDYSSFVKEIVNQKIPTAMKDLKNEIDELVEIIAWDVIGLIMRRNN